MKKWVPFLAVSLFFHAFLLGMSSVSPSAGSPEPVMIVLDLETWVPHTPVFHPQTLEQHPAPVSAPPSPPREPKVAANPRQGQTSKIPLSASAAKEHSTPGGRIGSVPAYDENPPREDYPSGGQPRLAVVSDVIARVQPVYPLVSRRKGEEGEVRLLVKLESGGAILSVEVMGSSGYPSLDASALAAVKKWGFSSRTPEKLIVPVIFRLK